MFRPPFPIVGDLKRMIQIKNLYKSFEDKDVLKDINATFENGKTNLIIGQSGSGKTVLMKNIVGLLDPTSGEILYDGRNFVAMSKREKMQLRREMGMIFQSAALFDSMPVLDNVMFPLDMFSSMTLRERTKRAQECLDRVNLLDAQNKYPGELSGGMQKRVAIARAISLNPKYLFCDEPNSGLDPKTSLVIDELLHSITQEYNTTTIINTHDMNSVMGIGENIIFIYKGTSAWTGNKDEIMTSENKKLNDFIFASHAAMLSGNVIRLLRSAKRLIAGTAQTMRTTAKAKSEPSTRLSIFSHAKGRRSASHSHAQSTGGIKKVATV